MMLIHYGVLVLSNESRIEAPYGVSENKFERTEWGGVIGKLAKIFILVTLFPIVSNGSCVASKAATKFVNDFRSLFE